MYHASGFAYHALAFVCRVSLSIEKFWRKIERNKCVAAKWSGGKIQDLSLSFFSLEFFLAKLSLLFSSLHLQKIRFIIYYLWLHKSRSCSDVGDIRRGGLSQGTEVVPQKDVYRRRQGRDWCGSGIDFGAPLDGCVICCSWLCVLSLVEQIRYICSLISKAIIFVCSI